ncbi:MAG: ABC transporter substrate-binding protein [Candidatus Velthaea sp.]
MIRSRAVVTMLFAGALTALSPVAASAETLRIATTPIDVGAQVYYAQDMGFFKKAGFDVEIQTISNGAAIAAAVASNAVDLGQGNVLSIITAYKRKLPFTIVAPAGRYSAQRPTSLLVATHASPIRGAADLAGKTVAVNGLRNILELGMNAWLDKNGASAKSVKFVEMPFAQMEAAVTSGRVDAAFMAEPSLTEATKTLRVVAAPYTSIAPDFLIGSWFTTNDWVKAHADAARRFESVMRETADWANKNPAKSAEILAKYTKLPPATLKTMARSTYSERNSTAEIQPVIDAAARYGFIDAPFPAAELIAH